MGGRGGKGGGGGGGKTSCNQKKLTRPTNAYFKEMSPNGAKRSIKGQPPNQARRRVEKTTPYGKKGRQEWGVIQLTNAARGPFSVQREHKWERRGHQIECKAFEKTHKTQKKNGRNNNLKKKKKKEKKKKKKEKKKHLKDQIPKEKRKGVGLCHFPHRTASKVRVGEGFN